MHDLINGGALGEEDLLAIEKRGGELSCRGCAVRRRGGKRNLRIIVELHHFIVGKILKDVAVRYIGCRAGM